MAASFSDHLHVTILSSPGVGHLTPVLVLAHRLAARYSVKVTVLLVTTTASAASPAPTPDYAALHHRLVRTIHLPPIDISHLISPSTKVVTQICIIMRAAVPSIRAAVAALDPRPDAFIVDFFSTAALPVAAELGIPKYFYVPGTAWFVALSLYSPILDQKIAGEYVDQKEYLKIPGCKPVRPVDVVDPMLNRTDDQYFEYITMAREIALFDGILLNTWQDLERKTLQAFKENEIWKEVLKNRPVYPIGPLTRPVHPEGSKSELTAWLDRQPDESVIYVSFGSGGVLSAEQITELAWGLELSRQRFLWVIRPPTKGQVDDAFFGGETSAQPDFLPDGFLTRTSGVGLVVPNWVPQVEVLNHSAVGGFLTHCGWNSTLESVAGGVPMIAWPLYAEQRMNAAFLVEDAGVAARPRELPAEKVVGREEIGKLVAALMAGEEGKVMRENVKKLQNSAADSGQDGGASHGAMCVLLSKIRMGNNSN